MAGMKFLNLKGWHPSNARNQKRIWIAEQKAKATEQAEREAAAEVRKHAETLRYQALAKGESESERLQVGFLYAPPPGLAKVDEKAAEDMTEDDAVREFRRKMEKRSAPGQGEDIQRPLERYVGRRPDEMLTIKEQVERFPFLKDAPVEGDYASNVKVNFKPMGRTLRNVKCIRCGEWGHQSGDRECSMRDANPNDAARQAMEDPLAIMSRLKKEGQLVIRKNALPLEMQTIDAKQDSQYEILLSDEEAVDPEKAYLAGLSKKEKKSLLKQLRKQSKEKKRRREASSESSSDSDSSSEDESRKHKKRKRDHKETKHRRRDPSRERHHRSDRRRDAESTRKPQERIDESKRSRHRSRSRSRNRHHHSSRHDVRNSRRRSHSPARDTRRHHSRSADRD